MQGSTRDAIAPIAKLKKHSARLANFVCIAVCITWSGGPRPDRRR